jgi:CRP/FNR family transcriptional regulator
LSNEELTALNSISRHRKVLAGQTIMGDEEKPDFFANVQSGVVKLTKTLPDGRQQIVGLQFASDFLGRPFGDRSPFFADAATDVELCCYPTRKFEELMKQFPHIEHNLFEHTLDELDAAREWMVLLGRKTAEEKVASFLLLLANRSRQLGCSSLPDFNTARFELPLTRADMGDYLGLTIETVSRQITRLKTRGLIRLEGGRMVFVPDVERLAATTEIDQGT